MEDRISSLPDGVICHILSFLPTIHAVATSVLSKRWYPLWRLVPILDFDDGIARGKDASFQFNEFVNSVLLSRDVRQPIKLFRLKCRWDQRPNVSKWVNTVLHHGVEDLDLTVLPSNLYRYINLPSGIFSYRSLVVLKLYGFCVDNFTSLGFPSLKILHLCFVAFPDDRCFKKLLFACPNLEDLQTTTLSFVNDNVVVPRECKTFTKLIRATIHCDLMKFPLEAISNAEFLTMCIFSKVDFNSIPVFYNLTHLELCFVHPNWRFLVELLKDCPKLQSLQIDQMTKHPFENWVQPYFFPECFSLYLKKCSLRSYEGRKDELQFASYVMQNAGALLTMDIYCTPYSDSNAKHTMIKNLSLCKRLSARCQLSFH